MQVNGLKCYAGTEVKTGGGYGEAICSKSSKFCTVCLED